MISVDNKKGKTGSLDRQDSSSIIIEESNINNASASKASSSKRGRGIIEESIQESLVSGSGGSNSSSSAVPKKNGRSDLILSEYEIERLKSLQQIKEFEERKQANKEKNSQLITGLLTEMNQYEQSSVSTLVVERMEKYITQSLARKD